MTTPDPLRDALVLDYLDLIAERLVRAGGQEAGAPQRRLTDIREARAALAAQPIPPPLDAFRCVKCGGTDISTRWDATWTDCTWSSRRDPGNQGEHLHRHCRNCSYGWGDPVAALSEPKP
jgi:hypothetical protein